MTTNETENRISSAVESMIPEDSYASIVKKLSSASSDERTVINMTAKKNNMVKIFISVAACILLIAGISGTMLYSNFAVESVIGIDVNPGIEITANRHDKVLDCSAVNTQGAEVLDNMDLRSTDVKVAVNAIIGSMVQHGYMADNNSILVTVCNDDESKAMQMKDEICSDINLALENNNADAVIIRQTSAYTEDAKKFAEENNISVGKATFILNIVKKDSTLNAQELAEMSISEIAMLVRYNNIDISDIADYDHDDSIWENIADSIEDVNEDAYKDEAYSSADIISKDEALHHAIKHSNTIFSDVTTEDIEYIICEYDHDNGKHKYEIEFVWHGMKFEYDIDSSTGAVLSHEHEQYEPDQMGEIDNFDHDDDHDDDHNEHHD
ncbi:MAG: PepSY domain-containing protein [Clostridia bacterium]|nr:PepSY domain-containing protein [Clostridia bacterium]